MKKGIVIALIIVCLMGISVGIGYYLYKLNAIEEPKSGQEKVLSSKGIEDECTQYATAYSLAMQNTLLTSSNSEKVTPSTGLVLKKYYAECKHTAQSYAEIPKEVVNMNKKELQAYYKDWTVEEFSSKEIILSKQESGICNEHYLLKEKDGIVAVYTIDVQGNEKLKEETGIYVEYLPEADAEKIKDGIKIFGRDNLNSTLEDFE